MNAPSNSLGDGCGCCSNGDFTYRVVSKELRADGVWEMKVLAAPAMRNDDDPAVEAALNKAHYIVWPEDKPEVKA